MLYWNCSLKISFVYSPRISHTHTIHSYHIPLPLPISNFFGSLHHALNFMSSFLCEFWSFWVQLVAARICMGMRLPIRTQSFLEGHLSKESWLSFPYPRSHQLSKAPQVCMGDTCVPLLSLLTWLDLVWASLGKHSCQSSWVQQSNYSQKTISPSSMPRHLVLMLFPPYLPRCSLSLEESVCYR